MANSTMILVLPVTLACLLVASHVFVQAAPAENELHYSGDNGDNKNVNDYTNTITDNSRPSRNSNQRPRPSGLFGGLFDGFDNGRSPQPSNYINQNQFGLGEPLFQGPPGFGADFSPQSLFERFQMPRVPLLDDLVRTFTETTQNMDRQFKEMSKNADSTRRSFFERNGVAFVETCVTKRVKPGDDNYNYGQQQQQQQQMQPSQQPMQPGQFQPSQVQPGQMQPAGYEQVSPDSDKSTQDQIVSPVDVSDDGSPPLNTPRGSSQSGTDSSSPASRSQTQPGTDTQSSNDNSNNNSKPTNQK